MRVTVHGTDCYRYSPVNVGNENNFHYSGTHVRQDFFYWSVNAQLKRFGKEPDAPRWMRVRDFLINYHFKVMERFWKA